MERARILDPEAKDVATVERGLTLAIAGYAGDARYFSRVNQLPGEPGADEVVLHFEFDRYRLVRESHPAYFPGALLTLTLYIWFNGPIFRDQSDLSARLRVEDTAGNSLVLVEEHVASRQNVGLFSTNYALPSAIQARTQLIRSLLDQSVSRLAGVTRPHPGRNST